MLNHFAGKQKSEILLNIQSEICNYFTVDDYLDILVVL